MPTYELVLLLRHALRPQLKDSIKRSANHIFDRGGFIRKIEYLGFNQLPYKISSSQKPYREAEQMLVTFDISSQLKADLHKELKTDIDVIRSRIYEVVEPKEYECELEDDLKPVPERKEVKKLLELERKKNIVKPRQGTFFSQTGLDYWPFKK